MMAAAPNRDPHDRPMTPNTANELRLWDRYARGTGNIPCATPDCLHAAVPRYAGMKPVGDELCPVCQDEQQRDGAA